MAEHRLDRTRDHIVDGYNLMHALGVVRNGMPQKAFEVAREEFLAGMRRLWTGPGQLLVCLDGHANPAISGPYAGLVHSRHFETRYSHRQTADDLILSVIAGERRPARLVIVSGDSDITVEARRKGCAIVGCVDWYASLTENASVSRENRPPEEKPRGELPGTDDLKALWAPDVDRQQAKERALPKPAVPRARQDMLEAMVREARALADIPPARQPESAPSHPPRAVPPSPADDPFEAMKEEARAMLRQTAREATAPRPDTPRPLRGAVDPGKPVGDIGGMGVPDDLIEECRKIMKEEGGASPGGRTGGL